MRSSLKSRAVSHSRNLEKTSLIAGALLLVSVVGYGGGAEIVPGTSNPFLAGMPNGSTCCSGDTAPAQSPVLVTSIAVTPGSSLNFTVTGSVDNTGATPTLTPDGSGLFSTSSSNGISGATWPINALVGVFLDASQPDSSAAPTPLDFSGSGLGTSFTTLSPALKQAFFIGDGLTGTGSGSVQTFVVPAGATRLFLGTSDGVGWFNNSGSFTVTIGSGVGVPTPTPTVPALAAQVPTLSFPMLALLGLALLGTSIFLIRRR
jgi:hypothetical protein